MNEKVFESTRFCASDDRSLIFQKLGVYIESNLFQFLIFFNALRNIHAKGIKCVIRKFPDDKNKAGTTLT